MSANSNKNNVNTILHIKNVLNCGLKLWSKWPAASVHFSPAASTHSHWPKSATEPAVYLRPSGLSSLSPQTLPEHFDHVPTCHLPSCQAYHRRPTITACPWVIERCRDTSPWRVSCYWGEFMRTTLRLSGAPVHYWTAESGVHLGHQWHIISTLLP